MRAACRRLGLAEPVQETVELYSDQVTGLAVRLPGWRYPIVLDTAKAEARFDNFGGLWGKQQELDRFLQAYAVERAKIECRKKGHSVIEQAQVNGSIKLTIQVSGGTS